jgi:hypothetical protein
VRVPACLVLAVALVAAPVAATAKDHPPLVLAAADREVPGGRAVLVTLTQDRIATSVEIGRVASAGNAGGVLDAIIIRAQDDRPEILRDSASQQAEVTVRPVRASLDGFDVDGLALATTQRALDQVGWFRPQRLELARDPSTQFRRTFATAAGSDQFAFVTYNYDLSPDFTQIRVVAEVHLARRTSRGNLVPLMEQRLVSIAQLSRRSYEHRENVAAWSADDGALAKAALTRAFAQFEWLLPQALELSGSEVTAFADPKRAKTFSAGLYGPLIERGHNKPDDLLIWSDGLVFVQSMP